MASRGRLIGRDSELGQLAPVLRDAAEGRGSLVLLSGEPGIGKTRLAQEIEAAAIDVGFHSIWTSCWDASHAPAYWPWEQVLREAHGAAIHEAVEVPSLDVTSLSPLGESDPGEERFRLFTAVREYLSAVTRERPIVVVMDDAHAAGASSIPLLSHIARHVHEMRLVFVVGYRTAEVRTSRELAQAFADLARFGVHLPLEGLTREQIPQLVQLNGTVLDDVTADDLFARTRGNPLFITEMVRLQEATSGLGQPRFRVTDNVREVMRQRFSLLSDQARFALENAAVIGYSFPFWMLDRLIGWKQGALLDALDAAEQAGILSYDAANPGSYEFAHPLFQEVLYHDLASATRGAMHRRIAELLEEAGDSSEQTLYSLAHHYLVAATTGDTDKAVQYADRAGVAARRAGAYETAIELWSKADALMATGEFDPTERAKLLERLGFLECSTGADRATGVRRLNQALAIWRQLGSPEMTISANSRLGFALSSDPDNADAPRARRHFEAALKALPLGLPGGVSALIEAGLTSVAMLSCQIDDAWAATERALRTLDEINDRSFVWCQVIAQRGYLLAARGKTLEGFEALETAWLAADAQDVGAIATYATILLAIAHMDLGSPQGVVSAIERELARQRHVVGSQQYNYLVALYEDAMTVLGARKEPAVVDSASQQAALVRATWDRSVGNYDAAVAPIMSVTHRWRSGGMRLTELHGHLVVAQIRRRQRKFAMAEVHLRDALRIATDGNHCTLQAHARAELALLHAMQGSFVEADRELKCADAVWDNGEGFGAPRGSAYVARALIQLGEGDVSAATETMRRAERHWKTGVVSGPWDSLELSRVYAEALIEAGERETARTWLVPVEQMYRHFGAAAGLLADVAELLAATEDTQRTASGDVSEDACEFRRNGDVWVIRFAGQDGQLRDMKGLRYLAELLSRPGAEMLALDLAMVTEAPTNPARLGPADELHVGGFGDAGPVLDEQAKRAYRRRITELREEVDEARALGDDERAAKAEWELEMLLEQLAGAVGLGGRDRVSSSPAERARVSVTKRIAAALERIESLNSPLREHLAATVRTGTYCAYNPDPRVPVQWKVE